MRMTSMYVASIPGSIFCQEHQQTVGDWPQEDPVICPRYNRIPFERQHGSGKPYGLCGAVSPRFESHFHLSVAVGP